MFYIYEIRNNLNGKNYIGQRKCPENNVPEEDIEYMGSGILIQKAFKKYGRNNFSKSILAITETKVNADILEKYFIKLFRESGKAEYNIADGGQGGDLGPECNKRISNSLKGHLTSEESRIKMSKTRKGRPSFNKGKKLSLEIRRKLSETHKGKGHSVSEETKKKISTILKGHLISEETKKKISEGVKKSMTPEICKIISEKNKERFSDPEARRKLSEAHKGKKLSDEHKKHISEGHRRRHHEF